jgi:hypothetical protein
MAPTPAGYHFLRSVGPPGRPIACGPGECGASWLAGQRLWEPLPDPLVYLLGSGDDEPAALYDRAAQPLMHRDLAAALGEAGVDNVDFHRAVLRDPASGRAWREHLAFNVLGLVSCAVRPGGPGEVTLAVDPGRALGLHLFRVAEIPGALVVDDAVREAVERRGVRGVAFAASEG